jgi:hypothetical protein
MLSVLKLGQYRILERHALRIVLYENQARAEQPHCMPVPGNLTDREARNTLGSWPLVCT